MPLALQHVPAIVSGVEATVHAAALGYVYYNRILKRCVHSEMMSFFFLSMGLRMAKFPDHWNDLAKFFLTLIMETPQWF